jgi:hypothetical protein
MSDHFLLQKNNWKLICADNKPVAAWKEPFSMLFMITLYCHTSSTLETMDALPMPGIRTLYVLKISAALDYR